MSKPLAVCAAMKTKHPIIVDLLNDSSDEDDKVEVIETTEKAAKMPATAKTPAAAAAMKRAQQKSDSLMDLSIAELKKHLMNRGISTQGCFEKADLVHRLENGAAAAMKVDEESEEEETRRFQLTRIPLVHSQTVK